MESNDEEEIKTVFASLYDTFVQYLDPQVIIQHNSWLNDAQSEFLKTQSLGESKAEHLFKWILEDDDAKAVIQFAGTLKELTNSSDHSLRNSEESMSSIFRNGNSDDVYWMKYLINLLDGSLINKLSKSDVLSILDIMLDNKILTKKVYQQSKEKEHPHKCCMKMFKGINRGQSNWPFVFFNAVSRIRPDLIPPRPPQVDKESDLAHAAATRNDMGNENSNGDDFTLDSNSEGDGLMKCLDEITEFSYSFVNESSKPMIDCLSNKEWNSIRIQAWIKSGNIDACFLVSNERDISAENNFHEDENHKDTHTLCLREYQKELAETALTGENTVICAPTGSGKTIVAVHIILNHLQEQQVDEKQRRKVVFFARTVPLVTQQFQVLQMFLPNTFKIISLTGDSKYSLQLELIIPEFDVIVMTPRILENHLIKNRQDHLDMFSLMIFDECHHTRKEEPYNMLMHFYLKRKHLAKTKGEQSGVKLPQIVGLTASIGIENASSDEQARENILRVCGNLDVKHISCVENYMDEVRQTVHVSGEELMKLRERENDVAVCKILGKIKELEGYIVGLAKKLKRLELDTLLKNIPLNRKSTHYGTWTVQVKGFARSLPRTSSSETNGWKRFLIILADYLSTYNVALELHDLVHLRHVMEYLQKCFEQYRQNKNCTEDEFSYFESFSELQEVMEDKLDSENPNLTLLKNCLFKYLIQKGETSCGMIFVRTRALAIALTSWLNNCGDRRIESLMASIFTGTSASVAQGGMTQPQQKEAIELFKTGYVRLLVATSVAEEGIDIPECNLVIKYNYAGNEITAVQTKGRSRKKGGMSIILAMSKIIEKELYNQKKVELVERAIKQIRQMEPSEIHKKIESHQQQILKDGEKQEAMKQRNKLRLQRQHFRMICHGCGDVVTDSDDIRTICQIHRIVINSNIFKQTKTHPEAQIKSFDDMRVIGPVKCMGKLEGGKHCNNKLGSLMIFSSVPFIVLGITRCGFETAANSRLLNFKNWKDVPFMIDEIGPLDFERYLPDLSAVGGARNSGDNYNDQLTPSKMRRLDGYKNASSTFVYTTHFTKAGVIIHQQKLKTSAETENPEAFGGRVTKTPERFQLKSGGPGDIDEMNESDHNEDKASGKTLSGKGAHSRDSSQIQDNNSDKTCHVANHNALCELDISKWGIVQFEAILDHAPCLESGIGSAGPQPILSGKLPSLQESEISCNDSEAL